MGRLDTGRVIGTPERRERSLAARRLEALEIATSALHACPVMALEGPLSHDSSVCSSHTD